MDFTLSNARRFYSSMGNLLDGKELNTTMVYTNAYGLRCDKTSKNSMKNQNWQQLLVALNNNVVQTIS